MHTRAPAHALLRKFTRSSYRGHNGGVLAVVVAALAVTFPTGQAVLRTTAKTLTIRVELARTPEQRARGLMGRASLPRDRGMAFLYSGPHRAAYWMKDVRMPLSIAFWDRRGRILKILDMPVCRRDPCPAFDPRVAFSGALEVNQGAFRRWRVRAGDTVRIRPS